MQLKSHKFDSIEQLRKRVDHIQHNAELSPTEKRSLIHEAQRHLAKKDLFFLAHQVLGYQDLTQYHQRICNALAYYKNDWQLHLHPRGHFKSTIITISESIQDILRDPNCTNLITNAVLSKAQAFLKEIKSHFIYNERLKALFPEFAVTHKDQEGTLDHWTTPARNAYWIREHSIETTGIDKAVVSSHYNKITFDDIVNEINVRTADLREKVRNKFREYLSLLNPPGNVRMVGTRWHYYDIYGWVLDRLRTEIEDEFEFKVFLTSCYEPNTTNPVFPERFDASVLDRLRKNQGAYVFSCQYLNDPQPDEEKVFDRRDLRFSKQPLQAGGTVLYHYSSCDPSVSQTDRSDPTALMTIAVNSEGQIFIINMQREWWNPDQIIQNCIDTQKRYSPLRFGFETTAFQRILKYFLDKEQRNQNQRLRVEELRRSTHTHKEDRIKCIQPYLKNGLIYVCDDPTNPNPNTKELLTELDTFPYGRYDDLLDVLSDCITLHKIPPKKSRRKVIYETPNSSDPYRTGYRYRVRYVETL